MVGELHIHCWRRLIGLVFLVLFTGGAGAAAGQAIPLENRLFDEQVLRPHGQGIVPIFDGWYRNEDGSSDLCFGYYSLNTEEAVDIPLGPANAIEPAEFDGGQPTHFDSVPETPYRRYYCVFTVTVPRGFGRRQQIVWTIERGSARASTPGYLHPDYVLDEPTSGGRGESAPTLRLEENGPRFRGRSGHTAAGRTVAVGQPLEVTVWAEHGGERSWLGWTKHQGPGDVTISAPELWVEPAEGRATVTVTFGQPGDYLLRVQGIDDPVEDFEFHCCWTNGYVPVTVTGRAW